MKPPLREVQAHNVTRGLTGTSLLILEDSKKSLAKPFTIFKGFEGYYFP